MIKPSVKRVFETHLKGRRSSRQTLNDASVVFTVFVLDAKVVSRWL